MSHLRHRTNGQSSTPRADSAIHLPFRQKKEPDDAVSISATIISYLHTALAFTAFTVALVTTYKTHWYQVLKNEVAGWPQEWFPSISAVTGDWYPARNLFQIIIAVTSGPRFLLILTNHLVHSPSSSPLLSYSTLTLGIIRTLCCAGWVYITSTDNHDLHDVFMIGYLVAGFGYMVALCWMSVGRRGWGMRVGCVVGFLTIVPFLVGFYWRHKVERVPGAYSIYALFEWSLIIIDVGFDHATALDVKDMTIQFNIPYNTPTAPSASSKLNDTAKLVKTEPPLQIVIKPSPLSTLATHFADTYLAFVFWTMTTSLAPIIWYFPLWNMGISGYESFLFTTLSPILLTIPSFRHFIHHQSSLIHLLSLLGLLSYKFPSSTTRLVCTATGVGLSFLVWGSELVDADGVASGKVNGRIWRKTIPFLLGLVLQNIIKVSGYSNNPLWSIMRLENGGWNPLGLVLGVLACLQVATRRLTEPKRKQGDRGTVDAAVNRQAVEIVRSKINWIASAVGFGTMMFTLHTFLTDSGVICRWAVDGYPHPGPDPLYGGTLVIVSMAFGLLLSQHTRVVFSVYWWAIGTTGVLSLYFLPKISSWGRFVGFGGGLVFTIWVMSVAPVVLGVGWGPVGKIVGVGVLVYDLLQLAHVWTVAYAFVPLGPLFRERTHYILIISQLFLLLSLLSLRSLHTFLTTHTPPVPSHKSTTHEFRRCLSTLGILFCLLAAAVGGRLSTRKEVRPWNAEKGVITAGIWTVHFGLDNEGWSSHIRMGELIKELELDIIGLLETDTTRIITGNRDLTQYLSETLGFHTDYGPSPTKHTWGCSLLSKFPILKSHHILLPSPVGELACAIHATLSIHSRKVDVVVSHNGQEEDWEDRVLQTQTLAKIIGESPNPLIYLGYLVTRPGPSNELYRTLTSANISDIDERDRNRWCQYIFYRGVERTGYARVSHGGVTDTEVQVGKFVLPLADREKEMVRCKEDEIEEWKRFPRVFRGRGVRGHRYHVFDGPKYWKAV